MEKRTNRIETKTRKKPIIRSHRDYDFLKYVSLVFKWATENHDLRRREIEILLYFYSEGVFPKHLMLKELKRIGMYQVKIFDKFVDLGYVDMWRHKKGNEAALYTLSSKAKNLCSRMHKMLTGEIKITENPKYNNLAKSESKIDQYYMDAIKAMNKRNEKSDED